MQDKISHISITLALQKAEKVEKQNWLEKDKFLTDLDTMKHKMRQIKGQYELNQVSSRLILTSFFTTGNQMFNWVTYSIYIHVVLQKSLEQV